MDRKDLRYGRPYRVLSRGLNFNMGDIVYYCGSLKGNRGTDAGLMFCKKCILNKGPGLSKRQWDINMEVWMAMPWNLEKVSKRELKRE